MKKILVTTDGSENSKKALIEAKKLAEALDAKVDILSVVHDVVITPYMTEQYYNVQTNESLVQSGEKLLEEALRLFDDFKGEVKTKLRTGNSGNEIIKEVEKEGYDLVVMGSRGLGAFSRIMVGSVSHKVLNHVETNVLIVK